MKQKMEDVRIRDVRMLVTPRPVFVEKDATADEIAKALIMHPRLKAIYVTDEHMRLEGVVTLERLVQEEFQDMMPLSPSDYFDALQFVGEGTAGGLMEPTSSVTDGDTVAEAFTTMYEESLMELPVVDDDGRLQGTIDMVELLAVLVEEKERRAGNRYVHTVSDTPFTRWMPE